MAMTRTRPDPKASVALAMTLLRQIAEDPMLRPSYRATARHHLAELAPRKPPRPPLPAEADDDDEPEAD